MVPNIELPRFFAVGRAQRLSIVIPAAGWILTPCGGLEARLYTHTSPHATRNQASERERMRESIRTFIENRDAIRYIHHQPQHTLPGVAIICARHIGGQTSSRGIRNTSIVLVVCIIDRSSKPKHHTNKTKQTEEKRFLNVPRPRQGLR